MRFPGSKARLKTIRKLIPKIISLAAYYDFKTVAIPLLGTGTGRLSKSDVLQIYKDLLPNDKTDFIIYSKF